MERKKAKIVKLEYMDEKLIMAYVFARLFKVEKLKRVYFFLALQQLYFLYQSGV